MSIKDRGTSPKIGLQEHKTTIQGAEISFRACLCGQRRIHLANISGFDKMKVELAST